LLIDTHCHLYFEDFDEDREAVILRAVESGVERIVAPGIDLSTSQAAIDLASQYEQVFAAVGVHPNDALTWEENTIAELRELAGQPGVAAIGEIGLDYYRDRAPLDIQKRAFRDQLLLAEELELPVIVHTRNKSEADRRAIMDVLSLLEEWQTGLVATNPFLAERPGVLHSFSGNVSEAEKARQLNFLIGITGPVTFRNAPGLQRVVESLPLESILVETDAPFLTPQPHRGKRNEPGYVYYVAEKIAQLRDLPFDIVADITSSNAGRLFNWRVTN
jgi:TatD DNase family protein